jgi:hypothetical protein
MRKQRLLLRFGAVVPVTVVARGIYPEQWAFRLVSYVA